MIETVVWMILLMMALMLINVPIAIGLGVVSVVAMLTMQGADALTNLPIVMYRGASNFPLLAVPLFIVAGAIMNATGISKRLIAFTSSVLGWMRGGLAMVTTAVSMFFAEISGSAVADVAALGTILIPAMKRKGYPGTFATAVTSSAATLAVIIPPSIPMVLYAVMANTSVVKCFVGGFTPGVLGGLLMMVLSYVFARKYNYPREERFRLQRVWETAKDASWAFLLPLIILGGIFTGLVTATEGAGLAVVAAIGVGLIYREFDMKLMRQALMEGGIQTAVVMVLVATSAVLSMVLTELQLPQKLAQSMIHWTNNSYLVLLILNVFFLILGCFLHSAAAIILTVPIVMPLVTAVGIDPVHFGIVLTINLGIGQQTPPVASVLITACAISKEDVWEVTKVNIWYIGVMVLVLVLVTYFPMLSLWPLKVFY
jgi:tripartite ATP-independent transporter DctM subunit